MKIPAIKALVDSYSVEQLKSAEEALYEEQLPEIEIKGDDEGEQLTHILAAIFIKEQMQESALSYPEALRAYTSRVRNSIS